MGTVVVTGSGGLVGAESVRHFLAGGYRVLGIDNNMRARFFGEEASTEWQVAELGALSDEYSHHSIDIRDAEAVSALFGDHGADIELIVHTAAQPSHDWAAREPLTDFSVNATGTMNLLEATRLHCPAATFIFTSTNKVYGDTPNRLPLVELETRWEIEEGHPYQGGIPETMSIDQTKHSLFGASKVAADVLAQEYGRYFGMNVGVFRGGCLTGPGHSGTQLHGFLSYLMRCAVSGTPYTIYGYEGKQVRDNIHSRDLIAAFDAFHRSPRPGAVYNIGGGRFSSCSMKEAIALCEAITGRSMDVSYDPEARSGDHIWWISDLSRFKSDFPDWDLTADVETILVEIHDAFVQRSQSGNG